MKLREHINNGTGKWILVVITGLTIPLLIYVWTSRTKAEDLTDLRIESTAISALKLGQENKEDIIEMKNDLKWIRSALEQNAIRPR